jgi:hypothetical protein
VIQCLAHRQITCYREVVPLIDDRLWIWQKLRPCYGIIKFRSAQLLMQASARCHACVRMSWTLGAE